MDQAIVDYLRERQIPVLYKAPTESMPVWRAWYRGHVDDFHTYHVYNGVNNLTCERKTLNMPARVCQRWADLLLNEKVEISVSHPDTAKRLGELLRQVNFYVRANNLIEVSFAVGGGFMIQYWDGQKTAQKYLSQEYMYPITYDSGRLTEAAFASRKTISGTDYIYLETHLLDGSGHYVVDNALLYADERGKLTEVPEDFYKNHGVIPKWETGSASPLFQQVRPNVANREDFDSPFGSSVFSGAVDIFKSIDCIYDSYYKEFILGKKRLFVTDSVTSFHVDPNSGAQTRTFNPNDETFYLLGDGDEPRDPITESNPGLRVAEHDQALQTQLNCLSQAVGFGSSGFRWNAGNVTTATQVISENSEMFRTLKKHEILLRESIIQMARGLLYVESVFGKNKALDPDAEISVNFDDSIIEDTAEVKRQAMLELNAGLIDDVAYYEEVYKMTENQALEYRDKIRTRSAPPEEPIPEDDDAG